MDLITELGPILAVVPALIIKLTNDIKPHIPVGIIFVVPYIIGVLSMIALRVIFNEQPLGVYIVNGVIFAYGAVAGYEFSKNKEQTTKKENSLDMDIINSAFFDNNK